MTDEARAEIRKHIQVAMHFGTSDSRVWLNKVLALIDAEDTPSVPIYEEAADRAIKFEKQFTKNLDPVISDAYFAELRAAIIGKGGMT